MRRIISVFISIVFLVLTFPLSAFAATQVASGTCGDNLTWILDDTGTLTINGEGAMPDYYFFNGAPWKELGICRVVIGNGITHIGDYAFADCTNLTSIAFPNDIVSIGRSAFDNTGYYNNTSNWKNNTLYIGQYLIAANEGIEGSYTIKSGTTMIIDYAFSGCDKLTSITIPSSVTHIGEYAFYNCDNLTRITLPNNPLQICENAFSYTGYYDNNSNWTYGALYIGNHLIEVKSLSELYTYVIRNGAKNIADGAFSHCYNLTDVTIPNSVIRIGNNAFYNCYKLADITIPNSVTYLGNNAFYNTGLTTINLPSSISCIENGTFQECDNLTNITIPSNIVRIDDNAFYGCSNLTNVTLSNGLTSIGNNAFYWCSDLAHIIIPDSITYIGTNAFYGCSSYFVIGGLSSSYAEIYAAENDIPFFVVDDWGRLTGTSGENLTWALEPTKGILTITGEGEMPDYRTWVDPAPWRNLNVISVVIEDGVTSIGEDAFYYCDKLTTIHIPNSTTHIGNQIFSFSSSPTIYTPSGSYAEDYAKANSISFVTLTYTPGNVDGQDDVTASDALLTLQAATNKINLNTSQTLAADVNDDNSITANDALLILQYATKKIGQFPTVV